MVEVETRMLIYFALCMLVGLIPVGTESRTTRWRREKRQREEVAAAAAAVGLDAPLPAKRKHIQHKVHECHSCQQPLSCKY